MTASLASRCYPPFANLLNNELILGTLFFGAVIGVGPDPIEALFLVGVVVVVVGVVQIPLWIVRVRTRQTIALPEAAIDATPGQFGIAQMLLATTVAAVVVAGTKAWFPHATSETVSETPWLAIIVLHLFFVLVFSLVALVNLAVVFGPKSHRTYVYLLIGLMIAAPVGTLYFLDQWS